MISASLHKPTRVEIQPSTARGSDLRMHKAEEDCSVLHIYDKHGGSVALFLPPGKAQGVADAINAALRQDTPQTEDRTEAVG